MSNRARAQTHVRMGGRGVEQLEACRQARGQGARGRDEESGWQEVRAKGEGSKRQEGDSRLPPSIVTYQHASPAGIGGCHPTRLPGSQLAQQPASPLTGTHHPLDLLFVSHHASQQPCQHGPSTSTYQHASPAGTVGCQPPRPSAALPAWRRRRSSRARCSPRPAGAPKPGRFKLVITYGKEGPGTGGVVHAPTRACTATAAG